METDVLKAVGQIAGIGGIALGTLLIIFRDIVRKQIFPSLDRQRSYQLLRLISILTWSVALAGIAAWVWVETRPDASNVPIRSIDVDQSIDVDHGVGIRGDANIGTIIINAPSIPNNTEAKPSD